MPKETKLGYGFLLAGIGVPYLISELFGPTSAFLIAIICTGIGIGFLVSGHTHRREDLRWLRVTAMVLLAVVALGASGWRLWIASVPVAPPADAIVYWGENDQPGQPLTTLRVDANGALLLPYAKHYQVGAVAFMWSDPMKDYLDTGGLLKSGLREILNDRMQLIIAVNQDFIAELVHGHRPTNYSLLLVPRGTTMEGWGTLREGQKLGILVVATHGGPPP